MKRVGKSCAAIAAAVAGISGSAALGVVQDYNRARGGDGYQVTHPGNGFYQQDGAFDGAPGAPGVAGDFFFSGSNGGFVLDIRAPLGQGATWDQSANLAAGDNGGYMYMDFFTTGTAGYPLPTTPPPYQPGNFWFAGAGNDAGALPVADVFNADLTHVLAYADVLAPAGKQFEFRVASAYNGQDNGIRFVGTGTGGWQTVGGTLASGGAMGSFDTADPNLSMMVVFGSVAQGPMTWDSGGAFGSTPAIIRFDNLTLTTAAASWQGTGGGNWSSNANWSPATPSGRNAVAMFGPSAAAQTVTLDSPVAAPDGDAPARYSYYVGGVVFNSAAGSYTLAGSEPLVIDTTAANGVDLAGPNGNINVVSGSHTISAPLRLNRTTNVDVAAGQGLTVSGNQTAQPGAGLIKSGVGTLEMKHVRAGSLAVNVGTLKITTEGGAAGASNVGPLTIGAAAKLDLRDNKLITTTSAGTASGGVYTGVQREVQRARNGGTWDGPGLTTTLPAATTGLTSIGVISAAQKFGLTESGTATFAGQTVTAASTLAMYTYGGDANLDGFISGDDYTAIDFNIATPGASGWANGDFNYDGIISGDDYTVIDFNIVAQGAPFSTSGSAGVSGVTAVPEPGALAVAALVTAASAARRRGRQQ